jgi:hypothetical protein
MKTLILNLAMFALSMTAVAQNGYYQNNYYSHHEGNEGYGYHHHNHHNNCNTKPVYYYASSCENENYNYVRPMNENDFRCAKDEVAAQYFDDSRLLVAEEIVGSNRVMCCQIKELMEQMSFESTRLALAKFAVRHAFDPENLYKLNSAFAFQSSVYELNRYIARS